MDLGRRAIAGICIAVDRQIHQHRIPRGQVQAPAPQHIKLLAELCIKRCKIAPVVLGPALLRRFAYQGLELCIAARTAELQSIDLRQLIKIQKLIIDPVLQLIGAGRHQTGDRAGDLDCAIIFQHRDPLIALLHIKAVEIFKRNDGGVDALFQVGIAQMAPFGCKLRVLIQQGHKVGGKGRMPAAGLGAHDALGRDIHQAQRLLGYDIHPHQLFVQHLQKRRFALGYTGPVGSLTRAQRSSIIFQHIGFLSCSHRGYFFTGLSPFGKKAPESILHSRQHFAAGYFTTQGRTRFSAAKTSSAKRRLSIV